MSSESDYDQSSSSERNERHSRSRSKQKYRKGRKGQSDRESPSKSNTQIHKEKRTVIKIPELSGYLVPFGAFMNNQSERIDNEKLQKAYNKYKKDWEAKHNEAFLSQHKTDAWFLQRYDPELRELNQKERIALVKYLAENFFASYRKGEFNGINLTITQTSLLGMTYNDREDQQESLYNSAEILVNNNINIHAGPYYGYNPDLYTLFIKSLPRNITKFDIKEEAKKIPGFVSVQISEPLKKMNFTRYCWLNYQDQDSYNKAFVALNSFIVKDSTLGVLKSSSKQKKVRVIKFYPTNRIEIDCQTAYKLIKTLDQQNQITNNPIIHDFQVSRKFFDLNLLYLRKVHAYDYFTATSFSDERALCKKLGLAQLRMEIQYTQEYGVSNTFKSKQQANEKRAFEVQSPVDQLKLLKDYVLEINGEQPEIISDKSAFKCATCSKKFVSADFLTKHIIFKHEEIKKKAIERILEQSYLDDPQKLTDYPTKEDDHYSGNNRGNNRPKRYNNNNNNRGRDRKRQYQDLDDPNVGKEDANKSRTLVNFLDI